jgi:hypothetical protein
MSVELHFMQLALDAPVLEASTKTSFHMACLNDR